MLTTGIVSRSRKSVGVGVGGVGPFYNQRAVGGIVRLVYERAAERRLKGYGAGVRLGPITGEDYPMAGIQYARRASFLL